MLEKLMQKLQKNMPRWLQNGSKMNQKWIQNESQNNDEFLEVGKGRPLATVEIFASPESPN